MNKLLILCAAVALLSTQAHALCRDDIKDMKPRIDRLKNSDPQRYTLAMRWWGLAQEAEPGSELDCSNFVERARKALIVPMAQTKDCTPANANQARCAQGNTVGPGVKAAPFTPPGAAGGGR